MYLLAVSASPANFSVQAGSLMDVEPAMGRRSSMTKSLEGKSVPPPGDQRSHPRRWPRVGLIGANWTTRNQSKRQDKHAGCRQTNIHKHRKGSPGGIAGNAGEFGKGERVFDSRSPQVTGKKLGTSTRYTDGVKGGDMHGSYTDATGEARRSSTSLWIKSGRRRQAESRSLRCGRDSEKVVVVKIRVQHNARGAKDLQSENATQRGISLT